MSSKVAFATLLAASECKWIDINAYEKACNIYFKPYRYTFTLIAFEDICRTFGYVYDRH